MLPSQNLYVPINHHSETPLGRQGRREEVNCDVRSEISQVYLQRSQGLILQ